MNRLIYHSSIRSFLMSLVARILVYPFLYDSHTQNVKSAPRNRSKATEVLQVRSLDIFPVPDLLRLRSKLNNYKIAFQTSCIFSFNLRCIQIPTECPGTQRQEGPR